MVNKIILDYLKKNSEKYPLNALRQKIISSGYSSKEVDEVINSLGLNNKLDKDKEKDIILNKNNSTNQSKPINQSKPTNQSKPINQNSVASSQSNFKNLGNKNKINLGSSYNSNIKKIESTKPRFKLKIPWMKVGGIFGFIIILVSISQVLFNSFFSKSSELNFLNAIFFIFLPLINFISISLFYFGFIKLGKFKNSKLVKFSALSLIVLEVLLIGLMVLSVLLTPTLNDLKSGEVSADSFNLEGIGMFIFIAIMVVILLMTIILIFFSIGLIKLGDGVEYSKIAGSLNLIFIVTVIFILAGLIIISIINPIFILGLMFAPWILILISGLIFMLGLLTILFESLCLIKNSKYSE